MDDMDNLTKFIDESIARAITSSQVENSSRLQKLVRLILFNRRQPFQFTDITIDEYKTSYDNQDDRPEIIITLKRLEKALADIHYIPNMLVQGQGRVIINFTRKRLIDQFRTTLSPTTCCISCINDRSTQCTTLYCISAK